MQNTLKAEAATEAVGESVYFQSHPEKYPAVQLTKFQTG